MRKKENIKKHQIAILISLIVDHAENFPKVTKICQKILDDLYDDSKKLRSSLYFQNLANEIESRVSNDLLMIGLLTIMSLTQVKANSKKAYELMKAIEKMCNSLPQNYSILDLRERQNKLETVMRKNYQNIQENDV